MARINPEKLSWQAPSEDVEGVAITQPLSYTLGVRAMGSAEAFVESMSFPGSLNADGSYSMSFADMALDDGSYELALLAFYQSNPELKSEWSPGTIEVILGAAVPKPPFGLSVI